MVSGGRAGAGFRENQRRQFFQVGHVLFGNARPCTRVDDAERAKPVARRRAQRDAGVEAEAGRTGDERVVVEARIDGRILENDIRGLSSQLQRQSFAGTGECPLNDLANFR